MCCLHLTETTLRSSVYRTDTIPGEKDRNRIWIITRSRCLSLLSLGLEYHSFHPDLNVDTLVWGLQILSSPGPSSFPKMLLQISLLLPTLADMAEGVEDPNVSVETLPLEEAPDEETCETTVD